MKGFALLPPPLRIQLHFYLSGDNSAIRTFSHETLHLIKEMAPEKYTALTEYLKRDYGTGKFNDLVETKAAEYNMELNESNRALLEEEAYAELSEKMLSDTEALEKFANRELDTAKTFRSQLKKVSDAIHNALNKLGLDLGKSAAKDIKYAQDTVDAWLDGMTTAISNAQKRREQQSKQGTQEQQEANATVQELEAALRAAQEDVEGRKKYIASQDRKSAKLYEAENRELLAEATQNVKSIEAMLQKAKQENAQKQERYSANDTSHYDYSKSFAEQIEDFKAGKFPKRDTFILGGTPDIYQKIGLSALPMTMEQGHVSNALYGTRDADHTLGETLLKQLPDLIKDPVAIIASDTNKDTSVVAIVKGTVNGKQIVAPVRINGTGKAHGVSIDSNHVATAFGKGNAVTKLLADAVNDEANGKSAVYYWKKTEALSLAVESGLQLPGGHISDGLIHSIFDAGSPVNRKYQEQTETQQFKRWFGKSVVKNADGTPKRLYHQTDSTFTVFETERRGAGSRDIDTPFGIFMKESNRDIGVRGDIQMELYARIEKPLIVQNREELVAKLISLSDTYAQLRKRDTEIDKEYGQRALKAQKSLREYLQKVYEKQATYSESEGELLKSAIVENLKEWKNASRENSKVAKREIVKVLKANGYDGVILREDRGSFGRSTEAYIALEPTQVKSATDNIGLFDRENPDIRFSLNDSTGRELTEAQQEYFKDSVIRDEQGRLKVMYHGAKKGGGFTVFKGWQYFTENKAYAERYGQYGNKDSMYSVYLDVKKPFDTRQKKAAKLYEQIRQEYGLPPLMEDGLPDWTAGYDLSDYIEENDLDYDAIILNEGGDMVDGKPVSRGESIVVRSSSQVKNIDNLNPTSNPDIRLSLNDSFRTDQAIRKVLGKAVEGETGVGRVWGRRFALPRERLRLSPPPQAHFVFDLFRFYFLYSSAPCRWGMKWSCS